tara:strand:+ start:686 stop:1936 length:1251 start_codon:yes stop_codon:yes gene_type:complete
MSFNRNNRTSLKVAKGIFDSIFNKDDTEIFKGIVTEVILDENNQLIKDGKVPQYGKIGHIRFVPMNKNSVFTQNNFAAPLDKNFNTLPIKNEKVDILSSSTGYFYRRSNDNATPNIDTSDNMLERFFSGNTKEDNNSSDYQSTSNTGISNKSSKETGESKGFGEVFEDKQGDIHPLRYHEGDSLVESRFGQSLRFSGYNNAEGTFSPTIILRNRENDVSQNETEFGSTTEEDVNRDGSTIVLSSVDYKLDFQPGVIDDGGSSNFENKPNSFTDYPSELIGDQILINSGRVIISSKESEMIFYSKGNYGFISDGTLSIDNKGGIIANIEDDTLFTTNNNNFTIESGTGEIHLGNGGGEEPIVKGDTLVDILGDLIDAINQMTHPTPAGPSGPPVNAAVFSQIKSRLKVILSSKNFVD